MDIQAAAQDAGDGTTAEGIRKLDNLGPDEVGRRVPGHNAAGDGRMIVWVWDAQGPDRGAAGVTGGSEKRARKLARESLLSTGASEVLVEQAFLQPGIKTLNYGYARTGQGWHGCRTPGGRVTWRRLAAGHAPSAGRC